MTPVAPGLPITVVNLTKRFGGITALSNITLSVPAGSRHAVIGRKGAGKSTLFGVISGNHPSYEGQIMLDGRSIKGLSADRVARLGIARSFQTSSFFPDCTVLDNVLFAITARLQPFEGGWRAFGSDANVLKQASLALNRLGLGDQANFRASSLSLGEARRLELALVLAQEPRVLLLDEPLAGLTADDREYIAALILGLPRTMTVLLAEHDLPFCMTFADQVTLLGNGEHVATGTPDDIRTNAQMHTRYFGTAPQLQSQKPNERKIRLTPILKVDGLSVEHGEKPTLNNISLEVRPGEIVAVLGRNRMGKTTLLTTLMGWERPACGRIILVGQDITNINPSTLSKHGLALVPQGRRAIAELTVQEELRIAERPGRWTLTRIYKTFPQLSKHRTSLSTRLSAGEQQLLAIARALLQNPRVMLLDEPTEGLNPLMIRIIRDVLRKLRGSGHTIVITDQNLDLALAVADWCYVIDHGVVIFEGNALQLSREHTLGQEILGITSGARGVSTE